MVELAKDRIDVGFYTSRWEEAEPFWRDRVGLAYEELLKVGNGVHQHRFGLRGSVCKVNSARAELPSAPTAFRRLVVAIEIDGRNERLEYVGQQRRRHSRVRGHSLAKNQKLLEPQVGAQLGASRAADDH